MEFQLLGPLQVVHDGSVIPIRAAQQRTLLAVLALHHGQLVPTDQLIDRLWPTTPPTGARATLRTYVMRLRKALGDPSVIETMTDGYRLVGGTTDLQHFDSLVAQARPTLSLLDEALSLWRSTPVDGLLPAETQTLADRHLDVLTQRCQLAVDLGLHDEAIPSLQDLVAQYPLHEHLSALLVRALHAAGRPAEALATYDQARAALADQLGIDPGTELKALHRQLLVARAPSREQAATRNKISQLPPVVGNFVGRTNELTRLRSLLTPDNAGPAGPVVTISGPPGVGKTSLAVRAAHELREAFPDGQLFVNLRGYDRVPQMTAADVLPRFLRALGVPPGQIPLEATDQASRYRAELAERRILVLLDNAGNADQVRPLLPDAPRCAVMVTSRGALQELKPHQDTYQLELDVLEPEDSLEMLSATLGVGVIHDERRSAIELTHLCGHLPLALRIAVGNLVDAPAQRLTQYVAELRGQRRLDALSIEGDEDTAVRKAFDASYHALAEQPRELFRLLSLIAGPDFTAPVAAALMGVTYDVATRLLSILTVANLIQNHSPERYQFHDLIKTYALDKVHEEELDTEIQQAIRRMLDHYLHSINNAVAASEKTMRSLESPPVDQLARPVAFANADDAERWLDSELNNALSAIEVAAGQQESWHAWHIADSLDSYLRRTCSGTLRLSTAQRGLDAAERAGDLRGQAAMHRVFGSTYIAIIDWVQDSVPKEVAFNHLGLAVALNHQAGNSTGEAHALLSHGTAEAVYGRPNAAIQKFRRALSIFNGEEPERLRTTVRANIGTALYDAGRLAEAEEHHIESLATSKRLGLRVMIIRSTYILGRIHAAMGRFDQAIIEYQESLDRANQLGMESIATINLVEIARNHAALGDLAATRHQLDVFREWVADSAERQGHLLAQVALAATQLTLGDFDDALATYHRAADRARRTGNIPYLSQALCGMSSALTRCDQPAEARSSALDAIKAARATESRIYEGVALTALATAEWALQNRESTVAHAIQALTVHRETGHRPGEAQTLQLLGTAELADGDSAEAAVNWERAHTLYSDMGMPQANDLLELLAELSPRGR